MMRARLVVVFGIALCPVVAHGQQTAGAPAPISISDAISAALKQVSALQQAEIDQRIAAEDVRQAKAALLPRARSSFSIIYNSRAPGTNEQSFIAQNAVHEYENLLGVP